MGHIKILFVILLAVFLCGHANAEETNFQKIKLIQYNGMSQTLYFVGEVKWSGTSCPNATYVQITGNVPGIKEIMSIGLSAKMAGNNVRFWGQCDTNPDYFNASYIVLE